MRFITVTFMTKHDDSPVWQKEKRSETGKSLTFSGRTWSNVMLLWRDRKLNDFFFINLGSLAAVSRSKNC